MAITILKTIERADAVRELAKGYPDILKGFASVRSGHKAHSLSNGNVCLEYTANASAVLAQWANIAKSGKAKELRSALPSHSSGGFEGDDKGPVKASWYGMGVSQYMREIQGETSLLKARLETAQKQLRDSGVTEALQELAVGAKAVRRREYSDSEGNYEYNRREEDFCFSMVTRRKQEFPFIELCYPIGMNCTAAASEISEFNARCVALAEILESVGYRVAITAELWTRRTTGYGAMKGLNDLSPEKQWDLARFPVREANDYGDILSFAPLACAEFFRRALFCAHYSQVHYAHGLEAGLKTSPDSGYGQSLDERPLPATEGQLVLDMRTVKGLFSMDKATQASMFRERIAHTIGLGAA